MSPQKGGTSPADSSLQGYLDSPKSGVERYSLLFLFLILGLALGLRVYHLGYLSFWSDEGFTRFYSESSLSYLWTTGFHLETNPPLYFTVMHFWIPLFGTTESALRSFSVIAALVAIVLVYALGTELQSRSVGLIGALLMALAPSEIWYAQEARTYILQQVAVGMALWGMARYLSSTKSQRGLVVYVLGAICAAYCHDTALLFVVACNLAVLTSVFWAPALINRRRLLYWLAANVIVGLAVFPLGIVMLHQTGSVNIGWIPPLTFFEFLRMIGDVVGGTAADRAYLHGRSFSHLLLFVMACLLFRAGNLHRRELTVLVLVPVFFIVLAVLANFYKPIVIPRVLMWLWVPLSPLLAHALVYGGKMRPVLLAILVLTFAIGLKPQLFPDYALKENWRDLVQANRDKLSQADVVVIATYTPIGSFTHYMPSVIPHIAHWQPDLSPRVPVFSETFIFDRFKIPTITTKDLVDEINSGKRVCLLINNLKYTKLAPPFDSLPPPDQRFDDIFPSTYELHILSWGYH